jgi:hypothetical protein
MCQIANVVIKQMYQLELEREWCIMLQLRQTNEGRDEICSGHGEGESHFRLRLQLQKKGRDDIRLGMKTQIATADTK